VLNADIVTVVDGVEGYFAVPIAKEDRHKTAIRLPISMEADGMFQLTVVLFGLKNGGTAFDRWMTSITAPLEDVVSMRDDIAITTTGGWVKPTSRWRSATRPQWRTSCKSLVLQEGA
jgi:hypothetical protein